jgi:hypothetical protein
MMAIAMFLHIASVFAFQLRIALLFLFLLAHVSHCEVVRHSLHASSVDIAWDEAGADFQPAIRGACSRYENVDAYDACAGALLDELLAADLKLWNARDGKNLTWQQRPPRLMPSHLQENFTLAGAIQVLQSYTDQSQPGCEIHQSYSSDDIALFVDQARANRYGPSYPEVDFHIYQRESATLPHARQQQPPSSHIGIDDQRSRRGWGVGFLFRRSRYRVRLHQAVVRAPYP